MGLPSPLWKRQWFLIHINVLVGDGHCAMEAEVDSNLSTLAVTPQAIVWLEMSTSNEAIPNFHGDLKRHGPVVVDGLNRS